MNDHEKLTKKEERKKKATFQKILRKEEGNRKENFKIN